MHTTGSDQATDCIGCIPGRYVETFGSDEAGDCIDCPAGKFVEVAASDEIDDCIDCGAVGACPRPRPPTAPAHGMFTLVSQSLLQSCPLIQSWRAIRVNSWNQPGTTRPATASCATLGNSRPQAATLSTTALHAKLASSTILLARHAPIASPGCMSR